jgi:hypothetical protein
MGREKGGGRKESPEGTFPFGEGSKGVPPCINHSPSPNSIIKNMQIVPFGEGARG